MNLVAIVLENPQIYEPTEWEPNKNQGMQHRFLLLKWDINNANAGNLR